LTALRAIAMCIEAEKLRGAARLSSKRELKRRAARFAPFGAAGRHAMTETLKDILKTDEKPVEKNNEAGTLGTSQKPRGIPPAGPHATERNTDSEATPGAGVLPDEQPGNDVDPGAG
jgi:hypothetical protein